VGSELALSNWVIVMNPFAYIEYTDSSECYFVFAQCWLPRDSRFIALFTGDTPQVSPRGLPKDVSADVLFHFFLPVVSDADSELDGDWPLGNSVKQSTADEWIASKRAYYLENTDYPSTYISNANFYFASWLNYRELVEIIEQSGIKLVNRLARMQAVLAAMKALADIYGEENVRLVYWFTYPMGDY
jgi:acyl carrier protein phosphodiesterase